MAFTRKMLEAMGIESPKVDQIIDAHIEVVDGLKAKIESYKSDAEQLAKVQQELEELKSNSGEDDGYKEKYEKEHADFEEFKKEIKVKETNAKIEVAYRKLLSDNNVGDQYIDSIIGVTNLSDMSLNEEGKIVDESKIVESIKEKWSGFIISTRTDGSNPENPPVGSDVMTKEAYQALPLSEQMQYANEHPAEVAKFQ